VPVLAPVPIAKYVVLPAASTVLDNGVNVAKPSTCRLLAVTFKALEPDGASCPTVQWDSAAPVSNWPAMTRAAEAGVVRLIAPACCDGFALNHQIYFFAASIHTRL